MSCNLKNPLFVVLSLIFIFCYNLIVGMQGFDMCDEGWVTTGYQQIFSNPLSVKYLFLYYNTQLLGGTANLLFGGLGILGFRIMTALTIVLIAFLTIRLLGNLVNKYAVLIGVFFAMLLCDYGILVFHHNYATALFGIIIVFCLYRGIIYSDKKNILLAGFFYGLDIFVRLPNVVIGLLILSLFVGGQYKVKIKLQMLLFAMLGFVIAIVFELAMMKFLGHEQIFFEAMEDMFSAGKDPDSTHNISSMLQAYITDYKQILKGVLVLFVSCYILRKTSLCSNKFVKKILCIIVILGTLVLLLRIDSIYLLYAFCTIVMLFSFYFYRSDRKIVLLSTLGLIYIYSQVLGSDLGVRNMGPFCLYWALPYSLGLFIKSINSKFKNIRKYYICLFLFCGLFYTGKSTAHILNGCYFDAGSRFEKLYSIDNPLASTYTTKRNVQLLNPMLRELNKYVRPNDYLLCFQSIPMVHFLTRTRPYLYNPWVWAYDPANLNKQIKLAERQHTKLPVIVRDKSSLPHWYQYDANWNNEKFPDDYVHKKKRVICINNFIQKHHYQVVWENEVFQILVVK